MAYFTEKQVKQLKVSEQSNGVGLIVGFLFIAGVFGMLIFGSNRAVENTTAVFPTEIVITQIQPTRQALLPTPTLKPTVTAVPSSTATATATETAVPSATATPMPTETAVPTNTPLPTATAVPANTATAVATNTPLPPPAPSRPVAMGIGTAVSIIPLVLSGLAVVFSMWGIKTAVPVPVMVAPPTLHDGQQKRPLFLRPLAIDERRTRPVQPVQPLVTPVQPVQPLVTPPNQLLDVLIPFDKTREPNRMERAYIRRRYLELGSVNKVCADLYQGKDPKITSYIKLALEEGGIPYPSKNNPVG